MPENNGVGVIAKIELKTDAASWALRAAAILGVMYGFGFLLMPDALLQLSGDPGSGEYGGAAWFIWMPIILLAALSAILWWLATK